jgi:hypothetical protein
MNATVSPGFVGLSAASALSRAHLFASAPAVLERIKQGAAQSFAYLNSPAAKHVERLEPVWTDPQMMAVEAAVDAEIGAEVSKIRVAQAATLDPASPPLPDMSKVNDLLARFEVLPPVSDVPVVTGTPVTSDAPAAHPQATTASRSSLPDEVKGISAADLDEVLGFDSDVAAADEAIQDSPPDADDSGPLTGLSGTSHSASVESPKAEKANAQTKPQNTDMAALREQAMMKLKSKSDELSVDPTEAPHVPPATVVGQGVAVSPPSAAAAAINAGAAIAGAVLASPARVLMGAARSLSQARQREAVQRQGLLKGATFQSLTQHNVAGLEKSIGELREARDNLLADPRIQRTLGEISELARDERKDPQAIIKEMRPGGKYEFLAGDWEAAISENPAFERFEEVGSDLVRRMGRDQPKLGNTNQDLLRRYQKSVEEGAELSAGIPARRGFDGDMLETLNQKIVSFGELIRKALDKVREALAGKSAAPDAGPGPN